MFVYGDSLRVSEFDYKLFFFVCWFVCMVFELVKCFFFFVGFYWIYNVFLFIFEI